MNFSKENIKQIRSLIVFTLLLLIGLWKYEVVLDILGFVWGIISPFILGGAIAFILNVPMNFIQKNLFEKNKYFQTEKGKKLRDKLENTVSLVITIFLVISILAVVIFVVVPQLGKTFVTLKRNIEVFIPKIMADIATLFENNPQILGELNGLQLDWKQLNWDNILTTIIDFFRHGAGSVLGSTYQAAKGIVSGMATFFIAFVFACYILLQKKKLAVQIRKVMYAYLKTEQVEKILDVCSLTYKTFSSFLTGQCMEAVILGTMFFVTMGLLKFPYALLVGMLIAVTALVPIFGAFIGCAVGVFLIVMVSPVKALAFIVLFLVLQQIEGNLIYPHVVGNSVGLPSMWVLVAVTLGSSLMGIVGMLVFIPITSVIYSLLRRSVYARLEQKKIKL
ncbi:AI-2E family transporter [Coprococcus sp. AF21-14LB]|uniref:AI-2E family transporter n=1 Tax=Coprococcus sp. AF21-14LB TaxID=2292231 RepID=UPI000E5227AC|nr:AI-2E family transporter [Coprococcus sp. AF21-14LB]QUO31425.1 AI-2E family transporter [Faecalicatena sp. Marseille-Q4148]RGS80032.1 AI-2E family transporter [Coprococcus sp. AF21-14LB]